MDVEAEIRDLKRRVGELEGSFGFLTRQVGDVHKDLLRFEEKTDKKLHEHDGRFDLIETRLGGRIEKVETELRGLRTDLPKIVGDTMREVNREARGRKRCSAASEPAPLDF
jgi:hypothetical protein